ncbi:MAG TPA: glycosyltransferase family 2 protein [Candidatus Angelobacter sp.]|nr:glycosyltransferase family 2 protein [Candidatus Angelobacter sp.]
MSVAIIIPVFNQLSYTRKCLESLRATGYDQNSTIVIDNGSTDGTADYLLTYPSLKTIHNSTNRGCAGAWNQGVKANRMEWNVVLNNDVVLTKGWLEGLVRAAELKGLNIVSPAICDGDLNYDLPAYAGDFVSKMASVMRSGVVNGVCFMVQRRVFERVGYFDENFRVGGFEDADFFVRAKHAGFKLGTTGRSYIHHFGSATQKAIKATTNDYGPEHRAYFRNKWGLNWPKRRWIRFRQQLILVWWAANERRRFGHSLNEKRTSSGVRYE